MGGGGGNTLEETAAFAAAAVCLVLVFFSILVDYIIHLIAHWLKGNNKIKLYEALEKIKSEFMLLGFMSLLLTVTPESITKICIKAGIAESWSPCKRSSKHDHPERVSKYSHHQEIIRRTLAGHFDDEHRSPCKEGKVQFISHEALHELHIFIFVLACVHVLNCVLTMALGKDKMNRWQEWEKETTTREYRSSHDPERLRYIKDTSFGRRHMMGRWTTNPFLLRTAILFISSKSRLLDIKAWIYHGLCMIMASWEVNNLHRGDLYKKAIYFVSVVAISISIFNINAHLAPPHRENFNFHNYIDRSLEEDFKVVVGIRPTIWFAAVVSLLFNKYDLYHSLWIPAIPVVTLLLVGTKLQVIISKMANRIHATSEVVAGTPLVQLGDDLFWFNTPRLLLFLINFVLFQNAFQVAFYAYTWMKFGIKSCFHTESADKVVIICMGLLVLILCSYVTLPLYALVAQMGSTMKPTIFSEKVANALKNWHLTAKNQRKSKQGTSRFRLLPCQGQEENRALSGHDSEDEADNLEADDQVHQLMPSSNGGCSEIGLVELAIHSPASEDTGSKDFSYFRRTQSSVEFRR